MKEQIDGLSHWYISHLPSLLRQGSLEDLNKKGKVAQIKEFLDSRHIQTHIKQHEATIKQTK